MKRFFTLFFFLIAFDAFSQGDDVVEKIRRKYAPDKRTAIFDVSYHESYNSLVGKTNLKSAKAALLAEFKNINPIDSILVLPSENRTFYKQALVNVSVANLRSRPEESAEMSSQMLLGMPLLLLEKNKGWYRVQCPDNYIGWVESSTLIQKSDAEYKSYKEVEKVIFIEPFGFAMSDTTDEAFSIRDLTFGNILEVVDYQGNYVKLKFPDKKTAYVTAKSVQKSEDWLLSRSSEGEVLVKNAKKFLGVPYLWGGTSFKGVDCSGFTRMAYFSSGMLLPRDASQQALLGELISVQNDFQNLKKGDLLFFGNTETSKVTHVALWLGDKSFIHSSGMVRIGSFDKESPIYDEYNLKRLLFVKRLNPKPLYLSGKNFYKF